jgi:hypothetical protein
MDDRQESKVTMVNAAMKALENNQTIWTVDTDIAAIKTLIEANRAKITEEHKIQTEKTRGLVEVKNNQRSKLNSLLIKILDGLQAIAVKNGDLKLEADTRYTETSLTKMRQEQFPDFAEKILKTANDNKADLSKYVSAEELASMAIMIADFRAALKEPKSVKNKSKTSTGNLSKLINDTISLLDGKMDKLIKPYEHTNPDFYHEYTHARKATIYGSRAKNGTKTDAVEKK